MALSNLLDPELTIAAIVLEHPECAAIFQSYRIDFCCQGNVSVEEAAERRGVALDELVADLEGAIAARSGAGAAGKEPQKLPAPSMIAHIISTHHDYLRDALPFVKNLANKVARVHGEHNARLVELNEVVEKLAASLTEHMDEEEQVLFPTLMSKSPDPAVLQEEFATMEAEHLAVGKLLEQMRDATEDYALPEWACTSYRTLFAELEAIEGDTLRHVHLETHALMPQFMGVTA